MTDVLYDCLNERPVNPSRSGNHLIDKVAIVNWKRASSSWLNRNTKIRLFNKATDQTKDGEQNRTGWNNREIKTAEIKTGYLEGNGYQLKTTYFNHANSKYSAVRRIITEV